MTKKLTMGIITVCILLLCLLLPHPYTQARQAVSGLAPSAWPKSYADVRNTGRSTGSGATGMIKWVFHAKMLFLNSSLVIGANNRVYMGAVYAIDAQTGLPDPRFQPDPKIRDNPDKSGFYYGGYVTPAIGADGTVYVSGSDNHFDALDGETGKKKWEFTGGEYGAFVAPPTIGKDGTIYIGGMDHEVYALDGRTGRKKWGFRTGDYVETCPAINRGMVYIGSRDKAVYALDEQTGANKWKFVTHNVIYSSPAIGSDGTVYIGSKDRYLYALDGQTGKKKWAFKTKDEVYASPSIGADGTVYIGSDRLYALDGKTGKVRWVFGHGQGFGDAAIASDGTLYVNAGDKNLYALDGHTGRKKWALPINGDTSPAIGSDGTIYVGADGKIYAIH